MKIMLWHFVITVSIALLLMMMVDYEIVSPGRDDLLDNFIIIIFTLTFILTPFSFGIPFLGYEYKYGIDDIGITSSFVLLFLALIPLSSFIYGIVISNWIRRKPKGTVEI